MELSALSVLYEMEEVEADEKPHFYFMQAF